MNNKDKEKKSQKKTIFEEKDSFIPLNDSVYYPNFYNAPEQNQSLIKYNDTHLLSRGGIMTLCAKSGVGKSSVMEAFISSHLNAESDSLGVNLFLDDERSKILFIDTERSKWEVHSAWSKLMKRAFLTDETDTHLKLIYASVKRLNTEQKREYIDSVLELNNDIGFIVFDGCSDFVNNTNDLVESNKFIEWLNTFDETIALAFTIHTNPTDDKPRGHLGSCLLQKSECVLNANRQGDIYEITTDFDNGKNRHGKKESWNYKYCEEQGMFISTTDKPKIKKPSTPIQSKWSDLAIKIFAESDALPYSHIVEQIQKCATKTPQQAKDIFMSAFKDKLIERTIIYEQPFWKLIKQ